MNYLTAFLLLISFGFRRAIAFETRSQLHRHTTASNESACTFSQFPQAIDHFGKTNGTLQQRYNLVPEFFETGGPILFFQGEEGRHLDCVNSTIYYQWAKELKGIAVSLEHRYFGTSKPFGVSNPTDSAQLEKFQYLTLDNVMKDAASFVDYLKKNISGASDSKGIVASGSYDGFLATVFRQNHPEAFYGAIASAPPLEGFSTSDPNIYNFNIWVNNVYQGQTFEASKKIENALTLFLGRFKTNATAAALKEELALCQSPSTNDVALVYNLLQILYQNVALFNYASSRPGRSSVALPLDKIIKITLTEQDPIKMLKKSLWMWWGPAGASCLDWSASAVPNAVPAIESPIFSYLTYEYKYLPDQANVAYPKGMFIPGLPGALQDGAFTRFCRQLYNVSTPSQEQLQKQYHITPAELQNSTRIIWSLGQYDPTNGISPNQPGINAPPLSADRNVSRILYTTDMAHREDLFAEGPSDRETVKQTRRIELESIKRLAGWTPSLLLGSSFQTNLLTLLSRLGEGSFSLQVALCCGPPHPGEGRSLTGCENWPRNLQLRPNRTTVPLESRPVRLENNIGCLPLVTSPVGKINRHNYDDKHFEVLFPAWRIDSAIPELNPPS